MKNFGIKCLSDNDVNQIIESAFRVLEKTGCRYDSGWARKQFKERGCRLEDEKAVIKFPRAKLEKFIEDAARVDAVKSRPVLHLPGAARSMIVDPGMDRPRPATKKDVIDVIRLCNVLDGVDIATAGVMPTDVPGPVADAVNASLLFKYSKKPFAQQAYSRESARAILAMAEVYYDGRDNMRERAELGYLMAPTGSLRYSRATLELARMYGSLGLPVVLGSMGRMGSEAPASVAGSLVMMTAEFLAGLAYVMICEIPGPVAFNDGMKALDKSGKVNWTGPEQLLRTVGAGQIAGKLGFAASLSGMETNARKSDFSAGWEKAAAATTLVQIGGDPFGNVGNLPDAFSIPQMLLDNEGLRMTKTLARGIPVDGDSLSEDVIVRVDVGGVYMEEEVIAKQLGDHWEPELFPRMGIDEWMEKGAEDSAAQAVEKARELLKSAPADTVVAEEVASDIDEILGDYMGKIGKNFNTSENK